VLESVLGATPREFESRILRHADLRRREGPAEEIPALGYSRSQLWSQSRSHCRASAGRPLRSAHGVLPGHGGAGRTWTQCRTPPRRAHASSLQYTHVRAWSHRRWQSRAAGMAEAVVALRKRRSAFEASLAMSSRRGAAGSRGQSLPAANGSWLTLARW